MQNMEKYFGFSVKVSEFLEPADYRLIRDRVVQLIESQGIDRSKYKIYLHQLAFTANSSQFGVGGGLMGRVKQIYLKFSINPKQRKTRDIQFVNHMFKLNLDEKVAHYYLPYEIGYTIQSDFFSSGRHWFQNVLITLVRVGVRENHKKLKVNVSVEPTPQFREHLRNQLLADSVTKFDLDFQRGTEFNRQTKLFLYQPEIEMSNEKTTEPKNIFNIGGNVGALSVDSPHSTVNGNVNVLNDPTLLEHVLKELSALHAALANSTNSPPAKDVAILEGVLAEAPKNPEALSRLRKLGTWAIDRADKIGLSLVTALLKGELGV